MTLFGWRCTVRSSWRSWFWNVVSLLLFSLMAAMVASVSAGQARRGQWLVAAGFGLAALWLGVGAGRSLFVGVFARTRGVVMRGLFQTKTIPWSEITEISGGPQTSGAAGAVGATTVIVTRSRQGVAEAEHVELNVLGGYGVSPVRPTQQNVQSPT